MNTECEFNIFCASIRHNHPCFNTPAKSYVANLQKKMEKHFFKNRIVIVKDINQN